MAVPLNMTAGYEAWRRLDAAVRWANKWWVRADFWLGGWSLVLGGGMEA
jgi:hypothetical protein